MQSMDASDEQLWEACRKLPSDFEPYGQRKWIGKREDRPDCATCCWFMELFRSWPDWGSCANPQSLRAGLLTFWEQGCWQREPEKGRRHEETRRARCDFRNSFEIMLREQWGDFIREEVQKVNDPLAEEEAAAPKTEDIRESPLFIILRRLLRHAEEDFRRQSVDEMAARARWEGSRYWEYARRFWARTVGEGVSEIRLPGNMGELEEGFWGRVDAAIREAFEGHGAEPDGEETQES
jgi:hypothetical protein